MGIQVGLVYGLRCDQALSQPEFSRDFDAELVFGHRLRSNRVIKAMQAAFQHGQQDFVQVEVYRKVDAWQSNFYYLGD